MNYVEVCKIYNCTTILFQLAHVLLFAMPCIVATLNLGVQESFL